MEQSKKYSWLKWMNMLDNSMNIFYTIQILQIAKEDNTIHIYHPKAPRGIYKIGINLSEGHSIQNSCLNKIHRLSLGGHCKG